MQPLFIRRFAGCVLTALLGMLLTACGGGGGGGGGGSGGSTLPANVQVSTFAGTYWGVDGVGATANLYEPRGSVYSGGYVYFVDGFAQTVRKLEIATGRVTTIAGQLNQSGSADGTGSAAQFNSPEGIATDGTNLYVADTDNHTIRKVVIATGVVTTLAGTAGSQGSADGTGTAAQFYEPGDVFVDGANLYVADTHNNSIRKIVIATGVVTTVAGASAGLSFPTGVVSDGTNLYVANSISVQKVVISSGAVSTLAGTVGSSGSSDGTGAQARFYGLKHLVLDGANLYAADSYNQTIRKIEITSGVVTTIAGTTGSAGAVNGTRAAAKFNYPEGISSDGTNLYVSDNSSVRKIALASGDVSTLAGAFDGADGIGAEARFNLPNGIATDGTHLYVADKQNHTIRKIVMATRAVSTLAGVAGLSGTADGMGSAARFKFPGGMVADGTNLYVIDGGTTIRKITIATGAVTTLAGQAGTTGSADGTGTAAQFNTPNALAIDAGNLYVSDNRNHTIRKIVIATGVVSTLAGTVGVSGSADGMGTAASFQSPYGLALVNGNLYVVDSYNQTIRKVVLTSGVVTTIAGRAGVSGTSDGTGTVARFNDPTGLATDGSNLYVSDFENESIRKIVLGNGEVSTLAGPSYGYADGAGSVAKFGSVWSVVYLGQAVYMTDGSMIRKITGF